MQIPLDQEKIANFCQRWRIVEFAVFGSVLREDFRPESDIDVLVKFAADAKWTLLDHVRMERELSDLLARRVDLVSKRAVEDSPNYLRRKAILESAEIVYAA